MKLSNNPVIAFYVMVSFVARMHLQRQEVEVEVVCGSKSSLMLLKTESLCLLTLATFRNFTQLCL